jgi:hypothetical protein
MAVSASRTSSSLNGLMMAMTIFMLPHTPLDWRRPGGWPGSKLTFRAPAGLRA